MSRNASRPIFLDETGNKRKVAPVYEGGAYDDSQKVSLYKNWPAGQAYARVNPTLYFNTDLSDPVYGNTSDRGYFYRIQFRSVEGDTWELDVGVSMPKIQINANGSTFPVWSDGWKMDSYSMTGSVYIYSITNFSDTGDDTDSVLVGKSVEVDPEYNFIHKADKEDVPELYSGTTKVNKVTFSVSGSTLTITTE